MAMTTAAPARVTKSRLSAVILEGTGGFVSLVLVLWLLLWFMWQRPESITIQAFLVAPEPDVAAVVPFQAADVRLLRGASSSEGLWRLKRGDVIPQVKGLIDTGAPVVIYLSDPAIADGPGQPATVSAVETAKELIKTIAAERRGDVLLALDLAQIDSDRDLGVFGNAPYQGLVDPAGLADSGLGSFMVLTSCAPAQRSWGAVGLGHSAFAHYLRKGLEGEAARWDEASEQITADGLARYVRTHVAQWAEKNCRAVQTPTLHRVGGTGARLMLPKLLAARDAAGLASSNPSVADVKTSPGADAKAGTTSAAEAKKDVAGADKSPAASGEAGKLQEPDRPTSPTESLLAELMQEWRRHEKLARQELPPFRFFPGAWRHYQASLLAAERTLLAAWHDGELRTSARDALRNVQDERTKLEERIEARAREQASPGRLRPAASSAEGIAAIEKSLSYLTRPIAAAPVPGKTAEPTLPVELSKIAEGDFPRPYLELQLPAWANQFVDRLGIPGHFANSVRADQLRRIVELRKKAELALAVDPRGNRTIFRLIEAGDTSRRDLQDELFAGPVPSTDAAKTFLNRLNGPDGAYDSGRIVIGAFHQGRTVLERIAADVPDLADWSIRTRAHAAAGGSSIAGGPLPTPVESVLSKASALVEKLDEDLPQPQNAQNMEQWAQRVRGLAEAADAAYRTLLGTYQDGTQSNATNESIAIELALRSPLLNPDRREGLLRRIVSLDTEVKIPPRPASAADEAANSPEDHGFWARAVGLAELDLRLTQLSGRGTDDPTRQERMKSLRDRWENLAAGSVDQRVGDAVLPLLQAFSGATREFRRNAAARAERPADGDATVDERYRKLQLRDREVRLLAAGEVRGRLATTLDSPVADFSNLGDYATLDFQIRRLVEDYVSSQPVEELRGQLRTLGKSLGVVAESDSQLSSEPLLVRCDPPAGKPIDDKTGEAVLSLAIEVPRRLGGPAFIPKGRAFLGGLRLPEPQRAPGGTPPASPPTAPSNPWSIEFVGNPAASIEPGRLLGQLQDMPPDPGALPVRLRVEQQDLAGGFPELQLEALAFYRGRFSQAGQATLQIKPVKFPQRVAVTIAQDREYLKRTYGSFERRIVDQFRGHQNEGYVHKGKPLAYVLSAKNVIPRRLKVMAQRFVVDASGQRESLEAEPEEHVLEPGAEFTIAGKITPEMLQAGPRTLELSLKYEDGSPVMPPFKVKFRQLERREYLETEQRIGPFDHNKDGRVVPCYLVLYKRRKDDKFTEPIMGDEISCTIEGIRSRVDKDIAWFPGDPELTTHQPTQPGVKKWTWSGRVGEEEFPRQEVDVVAD